MWICLLLVLFIFPEHVWQVNVQKKELGNSRNILGPYHLCLTDRTLSLVKRGADKPESIEFSVSIAVCVYVCVCAYC